MCLRCYPGKPDQTIRSLYESWMQVIRKWSQNKIIANNEIVLVRSVTKVNGNWLQKLKGCMTRPTQKSRPEVHWEDLLNLFFGTLADDVKRIVEFHKDPHDNDEAVDHVVYYCETGRCAKTSDEKCQCNVQATKAEPDYSGKETSSSEDDGRVT